MSALFHVIGRIERIERMSKKMKKKIFETFVVCSIMKCFDHFAFFVFFLMKLFFKHESSTRKKSCFDWFGIAIGCDEVCLLI